LCNLLLDDIYNGRLGESAEITKLVAFTSNNLAQNSAHDLHYMNKNKEPNIRGKGRTFAERVFGKSLTMKTSFGAAKGAMTLRT
jgi:hypothetical protein